MRSFFRSERGNQPTPLVIPKVEMDRNPSGMVATYQPDGPTLTSRNAFFADLGTNGRTCFTCHQPAEGWTISATGARARFERSLGSDPLFRPIRWRDMPERRRVIARRKTRRLQSPDQQGADPDRTAHAQGAAVRDDQEGGRGPLPSTNLGFLSTIMWDGREPDLASQVVDATLIHAQAASAPSKTQIKQIVGFESGIFNGAEL